MEKLVHEVVEPESPVPAAPSRAIEPIKVLIRGKLLVVKSGIDSAKTVFN